MDGKGDPQPERIAKVMARAGVASRREAEGWITAGRVTVNGKVIASPALDVGPDDRIEVDGEPLPQRERTRLFLYHKPRGLVTTSVDPQGRPTIFQHLPKNLPRLISIGRLDITSEGLLLLTNDGGLARTLELPETGWLRSYRVRAHGSIARERLDALRDGISVDGVNYGSIEATLDRAQGANVWITFAMREGKNREVRNVLGALGLAVNRLIRVSFGPFRLGDLSEGAIDEVPTRMLSQALGEDVGEKAGIDLTGPLVERAVARAAPLPPRVERATRRARPEPQREEAPSHDRGAPEAAKAPDERRPRDRGVREESRREKRRPTKHHSDTHVWRGGDAPLRRKFRGARRGPRPEDDTPNGPKRTGLVADRKGRRVLVERHGEKPPPAEEPRQRRDDRPHRRDEKRPGDKRRDGHRAKDHPKGERGFDHRRPGGPRRPPRRDRGSGPRPSRPKD